MCTTRQWKSLETRFRSNSVVMLVGVRSDNLIVQIPVHLPKADHVAVISMANAVKRLESYKNCSCTPDGPPCDKHKS